MFTVHILIWHECNKLMKMHLVNVHLIIRYLNFVNSSCIYNCGWFWFHNILAVGFISMFLLEVLLIDSGSRFSDSNAYGSGNQCGWSNNREGRAGQSIYNILLNDKSVNLWNPDMDSVCEGGRIRKVFAVLLFTVLSLMVPSCKFW